MSIDSSSGFRFQETEEALGEVDFRGDELDFLQEDCTTMHKADQEVVNDDDDSLQILRGFVEEFGVKGHEMLEKLVSRVEERVPIEKQLREKLLYEFQGRPGSDILERFLGKPKRSGGDKEFTITDRGVDGNISESEDYKLERFKVKSVNVIGSGVVKEEEH